jgi:ribosomal protein S27AE
MKKLKRFDLGADSSDEMTTIRTTCPRCGEVDMGPEAILLSVRENGREGSYRFRCPNCADRVEKRADRKIVALLVSAGVDIERNDGGSLEPEGGLFDHEEIEGPANPELAPEGPLLSVDDLIEFHYLLEDDRYIQDFPATQ